MSQHNYRRKYLVIAGITCVFFWVADTLADCLFFGEELSFAALFSSNPREIWMRSVLSLMTGGVILVAGWLLSRSAQAENALRHSDELSRVLFESTRDAICVIESAGLTVTGVNSLFLQKHRLTEKEALGQTLLQLIRNRSLPAEGLDPLRDTAITGESATQELVYLGRDGELVYEEVATYPVGDPARGTAGALYVSRDITQRKRSEWLLKESEERYRAIFETTGSAMAIVAQGGLIRMVNRGFEELTGYAKEQLEGRTLWREIFPEHEALVPLQVSEYCGPAVTAPRSFELSFPDKGGAARTVAGNCSSIAGAEEMVISLLDITEQKRAELALRESRSALALAQRISHLGNWVWDVTVDVLTWSEEMYRVYGLDPETFSPTFEGMLQAVHPDDRESVIKAVNDALYNKKPLGLDYRIQLPTAEVRTISCRGEVSYDAQGTPLRIVGTDQDVTWRKEAEEALRSSEEKFSKAFVASPDPIVIMSASDNTYIDANDAFLQSTGYSREELLGERGREVQLWSDPEARMEMLKILNRFGHVRNLDVRFRMKSGETRQLLWSAEIIEYRGDACLIAVCRDVTEQRQLERDLQKSEARLFMKHEELKSLFQQMESIRREWEETMDSIGDMFIVADPSGRIRRFNRAVETFCGKPHRDIVGREWTSLMTEYGLAAHLAAPGVEIFHQASGRRLVLHRYSFTLSGDQDAQREVIIVSDTTAIGRRHDGVDPSAKVAQKQAVAPSGARLP